MLRVMREFAKSAEESPFSFFLRRRRFFLRFFLVDQRNAFNRGDGGAFGAGSAVFALMSVVFAAGAVMAPAFVGWDSFLRRYLLFGGAACEKRQAWARVFALATFAFVFVAIPVAI